MIGELAHIGTLPLTPVVTLQPCVRLSHPEITQLSPSNGTTQRLSARPSTGLIGEFLNGAALVRRNLRRCNSFCQFILCNGQAGSRQCSFTFWRNDCEGRMRIFIDRCGRRDACTTSQIKRPCIAARASMGVTIVGTASMYDPFQPGYDEGGIETASGELYDPMAWTAAIHTDLRETFGGVRYGKDYRPAYALVEVADKRAIVEVNDVGPLKPSRVINFNQQTMHYFDPSLQLEIVHGVRLHRSLATVGSRPNEARTRVE